MEPSPQMIEFLLGPAIAHMANDDIHSETTIQRSGWEGSFQNPKNRIECEWKKASQWQLFRADFIASKISAVPRFALHRMPLRIDIFLCNSIDLQKDPWRSMRPSLVSTIQSSGSVRSDLADYIISALEVWSSNLDGFERLYMDMPFGSRILVETIEANVHSMQISFDPDHNLELQWCTLKNLEKMWNIPAENWPPVIEINELELVAELHESISLISVKGKPYERFVLKSSTSGPRYLYHELRLLLSIQPHPNIIGRPSYIVTKKVKFGGKKGVCGFLLEYHPAGNLARAMSHGSSIFKMMNLETRFRWSYQIASALAHIKRSPARLFSDMKLENVVLKETNGQYDVVLIDFEQRGAWFSWSPPEINKITHLTYLATRSPCAYLPPSVRKKYRDFLDTHLPSWNDFRWTKQSNYGTSDVGYNMSWRALNPEERNQAVVFMLGRILWCIFEAQGSANAAEFLGAEVFREVNPDHRFPEFRQTPKQIRTLIMSCTRGAPEWSGIRRCIKRVDDSVYDSQSASTEDGMLPTVHGTVNALRQWWTGQLREAEDYLIQRSVNVDACRDVQLAKARPQIEEVVDSLRKVGEAMGFNLK
jgi:hypothetical protein